MLHFWTYITAKQLFLICVQQLIDGWNFWISTFKAIIFSPHYVLKYNFHKLNIYMLIISFLNAIYLFYSLFFSYSYFF